MNSRKYWRKRGTSLIKREELTDEDINEMVQDEVNEGVDPNPNAPDKNKDKDSTTVNEDKKAGAVKLVEPKKADKKPDANAKKEEKPPPDGAKV